MIRALKEYTLFLKFVQFRVSGDPLCQNHTDQSPQPCLEMSMLFAKAFLYLGKCFIGTQQILYGAQELIHLAEPYLFYADSCREGRFYICYGIFRILSCLRECSLFTREGGASIQNYMYQNSQYYYMT